MNNDLVRFQEFARNYVYQNRPFFNNENDIFFARAPGRLDVMGGIADYSGSLVLEMPIAEAVLAAVQLDSEPTIRIISLREGQEGVVSYFSMPLADFTVGGVPIAYDEAADYVGKTADSRWAAYIAGAFLVLTREKQASFSQGARILLRSNVPEGKGVSSSAAVEVAAMLGISKAFGLTLEPTELATLCQIVENQVAKAPCGIMDQMTVVHGRKNKLLELLCQPDAIQGSIEIPSQFRFWGIDSGIRHAVSGSDYGAVRVGAFMGYKIIQIISGERYGGYLANVAPIPI